jgi:hypothetical protein
MSSKFTYNLKCLDVSNKSAYGYILGVKGKLEIDSVKLNILYLRGYVVFNIEQYDGGILTTLTHSIPYVEGPLSLSIKQEKDFHVIDMDGDIVKLQRNNNKKIYRINQLIDEVRDQSL